MTNPSMLGHTRATEAQHTELAFCVKCLAVANRAMCRAQAKEEGRGPYTPGQTFLRPVQFGPCDHTAKRRCYVGNSAPEELIPMGLATFSKCGANAILLFARDAAKRMNLVIDRSGGNDLVRTSVP
jgi:hypothetical protein